MCSIFSKPICLTGGHEAYISLFEAPEEFELYQLRIGLQNLCQNTLYYPRYSKHGGGTRYEKLVSPHAMEFYDDACLDFRTKAESNVECCDNILRQIADYFFDGFNAEYLNPLEYTLFPYDPEIPQKCYIRYQCPHVHLHKFGFPIYVHDQVIAVLFTGQFSIEEKSEPEVIIERNWWGRILGDAKPTPVPPSSKAGHRHSYESEAALMQFVSVNLLPIVRSFSKQAENNLRIQQKRILQDILDSQIACMDAAIMDFLLHMDTALPTEKHGFSMREQFWMRVAENLNPYLDQVGVNSLLLFIDDQHPKSGALHNLKGLQLYPMLRFGKDTAFNMQKAQEAMAGEKTCFSLNDHGAQTNACLFDCLQPRPDMRSLQVDFLAHSEKIQPFAAAIFYHEGAEIITNDTLRRTVLEQLEVFFTKVGQKLAYFAIRMSEHTTKTVLRIYRHEISHQTLVLARNNWFLDLQRLRDTDENKLRHVAEDQRQCIFELDFMTQNIDVVTGNMKKRIAHLGKERPIDVSSDLINKAISLYQRKKQEKTLWFAVQNHSAQSCLHSNLELLDLIFFNLMSNAIKYAHPGTKIIFGVEDTDSHAHPHRISLTDFGTPVDAEEQDQVFQMYFRSNAATHIEGSGIGLYVAKNIAEQLNARLLWDSGKVSDYNIPMLLRYLSLPEKTRAAGPVDPRKAQAEFDRLHREGRLPQVVNKEFLLSPGEWSVREIFGELMRPTYEVKFALEL